MLTEHAEPRLRYGFTVVPEGSITLPDGVDLLCAAVEKPIDGAAS